VLQHVESAKTPLLREYTRKGIVGSNPIFSAIKPLQISTICANVALQDRGRSMLICTHSNANDSRTCATARGKSGGLSFPHVLHPQFPVPVDIPVRDIA